MKKGQLGGTGTRPSAMFGAPPSLGGSGGIMTGFGTKPPLSAGGGMPLPPQTFGLPTQGLQNTPRPPGLQNWQQQVQQNPLLGTQMQPIGGANQLQNALTSSMANQGGGSALGLAGGASPGIGPQFGGAPQPASPMGTAPGPQFGGAPQVPNNVPPMGVNPGTGPQFGGAPQPSSPMGGGRMPGLPGLNDYYYRRSPY